MRCASKKVVAVNDVGKVINPKTAGSQVVGGVVMGIGMALMEEAVLDPHFHRYANDTFAEYHAPTNRDAPEIEAHFVGEPDTVLNPLGARGSGRDRDGRCVFGGHQTRSSTRRASA